jgi:hypothetical protein
VGDIVKLDCGFPDGRVNHTRLICNVRSNLSRHTATRNSEEHASQDGRTRQDIIEVRQLPNLAGGAQDKGPKANIILESNPVLSSAVILCTQSRKGPYERSLVSFPLPSELHISTRFSSARGFPAVRHKSMDPYGLLVKS